jgi:transposase-like protein
MIPKAREVRLKPKVRQVLEARCRAMTTAQRDVKRARIAVGRSTRLIAEEVGVQPRIFSNWRRRFAEHDLGGLTDRPRAGKKRQGRRVVAAFIGTAFVQDDADAASKQWRAVADQLRAKVPKLAGIMDEAEADVLAFMTFPKDHRPKIHSINPLERLNGEIKRRTEVVGIFPNEDAIHTAHRRLADGTERRMGGAARPLHEPGNNRPVER